MTHTPKYGFRFQTSQKSENAQNPNLAPKDFVEDQKYLRGDVVKYDAPQFGANAKREYIAINDTNASPKTNNWKPLNSDDYEHGKQLFSEYQCVQCHAINRTGIGAKGPNLTFWDRTTMLLLLMMILMLMIMIMNH